MRSLGSNWHPFGGGGCHTGDTWLRTWRVDCEQSARAACSEQWWVGRPAHPSMSRGWPALTASFRLQNTAQTLFLIQAEQTIAKGVCDSPCGRTVPANFLCRVTGEPMGSTGILACQSVQSQGRNTTKAVIRQIQVQNLVGQGTLAAEVFISPFAEIMR